MVRFDLAFNKKMKKLSKLKGNSPEREALRWELVHDAIALTRTVPLVVPISKEKVSR